MCLITFAYKAHPKYKLILVANRDEFYARPTAKAHWWEDHQEILGGRDLQAMGTWMAIHKNGSFAAVTNYRDVQNLKQKAKSRGELPVNFLLSEESSENYSKKVLSEGGYYNGFNLLTLRGDEMVYISNYADQIDVLNSGVYGLSNALLESPWYKVEKAKSDLKRMISEDIDLNSLIAMMKNANTASDETLPQTGLSYDREKALSAMWIATPDYGTCSTSALTIDYDDNVVFIEKSYPVGERLDETVSFTFQA